MTKLEVMQNSNKKYDVLDESKFQQRLYPNLQGNSLNITENIEMREVPFPKYATVKPHDYTVVDVERKTDQC